MVVAVATGLAEGQAVAVAVGRKTACRLAVVTTAAATLGVARAQPTLASPVPLQVTATAITAATSHAASVARRARAHQGTTSNQEHRATKSSARTHAVRVSTWASNATTLTNASQPAMCLPASRHPVFHRGVTGAATAVVAVVVAVAIAAEAVAVVTVAAVEAVAVAIGVAARALVVEVAAAVVAAATRAADSSADQPGRSNLDKSGLGLLFVFFSQSLAL